MKDLPCIFTVYVILALYVFRGVSREVVGGNIAVNVETRGLVHIYEEVETFHQLVDEVRRILPMDNWSVRVARKATTLGGDDIFCRLKAKQIEPLFDGQARGRRAIPSIAFRHVTFLHIRQLVACAGLILNPSVALNSTQLRLVASCLNER